MSGRGSASGAAEARYPYQYVVLRCVPRVEREEFVNVGIVLYCQQRDFLGAAANAVPARLAALAPQLEVDGVLAALRGVEAVCRADDIGSAHLGSSRGQRFGWLAAPRSTVLQPSAVHGGLTGDPERELERLLELLVS